VDATTLQGELMSNGFEEVRRRWPYHGPYDQERTIEAAEAIAELVRYLNNAIEEPDAVPHPNTVSGVLSPIAAATRGLEQLLHQILELLDLTAANARDNRRDRPATATISEVVAELAGAGVAADVLAERLERAARHASHLTAHD
jgi:hypothetical protein